MDWGNFVQEDIFYKVGRLSTKYLIEIPETIPDVNNPEMNMQVLKNYFNSLEQLLIKYVPNHNLELS